ncbi:MAG: Uridine kinase [Caeruleum heppii]|nr:MAG: Uridine kinase [Caeruleum heppii]
MSLVHDVPDWNIKQVIRDVRERGRDLDGIMKQWFNYVKPNFERYVDPQRKHADMVVKHIQQILIEKSKKHRADLERLGREAMDEPLSENVLLLPQTPQTVGMSTIIQDAEQTQEDFIFYFDRLAALLIERALDNLDFRAAQVETPKGHPYDGLLPVGGINAVVVLRAGAAMESGLRRVIPDCRTGRILIRTNHRHGEPELHYCKLPTTIRQQDHMLMLDPQMSSGGAALMAVRVLVDHGVPERKIVFVTYFAGKMGLNRLCKVFPGLRVVAVRVTEDHEKRWVARRYFGC